MSDKFGNTLHEVEGAETSILADGDINECASDAELNDFNLGLVN